MGLTACTGEVPWNATYGEPDVENGQQLYTTNCQMCHGDKGLGDGPVAESLPVMPANIHQELSSPFSFRTELTDTVLNGMGEGDDIMPIFASTLSKDDLNDIFAYIEHANLVH